MAAVPSIGRADRVSGAPAPEADLTRALYERYSTQIFRFCLHQLGSREEAEDAVQSTFLNAFRGIKRGVVPELESAWLFKIAENVCLSRRRSTWRRNRIESPADFALVEELTPAPSRLADELVGLQDVLERMPESQRRAILLREWQGLSYREIAAELELSQTAVETLIFRARRSLAKGLADPPAPAQKRRMVRGADLGNILTGLKSILFGSAAAAAKTAAIVAVVGAGTVAVAEPAQHHPRTHLPASPPASVPAASLTAPGRASIRPAPAPKPHRTHPSASKAAAGSAPRPPIADLPVAAADAAPPHATPDEASRPPASPPAAQTPPASAPPAPNGHGRGRGEGQGTSGQGKGQGQGSSGGQSDPGQGQDHGQGGSGQAQAQGNSGRGQGSSDSSPTGPTPPPAGGADTGGNGGNGQVNGQSDGGGHGAGAGHGH